MTYMCQPCTRGLPEKCHGRSYDPSKDQDRICKTLSDHLDSISDDAEHQFAMGGSV